MSVGDTTFVSSREPQRPDTARVRVARRYGTVDGGPGTILVDVTAFAVGPDGDVYTGEASGGLKRFDATTGAVRILAPEGPGPAEVDNITGIGVGPEGRIVFRQAGNPRVSIVDPDGRFENHIPPKGWPGRGGDAVQHVAGEGFWLRVIPALGGGDAIPFPRPTFVRLSSDGQYPDTLRVSDHPACPTRTEGRYRAGFWEDKREPFVPKTTWALGPDGSYAVGCPSRYSLRVLRPSGRTLVIDRPHDPILMTDGERSFWEGWDPMPPLPKERPAYARIVLTADGRIWVWPTQPSERYELDPNMAFRAGRGEAWRLSDDGAFDVFSPGGRWIGTVAMPEEAEYSGYPTTPGVVIRGDTIWALSRNELDVEQITRYHVMWP